MITEPVRSSIVGIFLVEQQDKRGTAGNLPSTPKYCRTPARAGDTISQLCRALGAVAQSPSYCFFQPPEREVDVFPILLLARPSAGCSARLDVGEPCAWEDNSAQ